MGRQTKPAQFSGARPARAWRLLLLAAVLGWTVAALAEGNNEEGGGKRTKRTTVDFTDQLIEGQAQKPELFYLLQQKNENNRRLIRLRENFLPEMRRTAEDVGRSRARGSGASE
jgi:hypothetical protein